jgi:hypothetical protein
VFALSASFVFIACFVPRGPAADKTFCVMPRSSSRLAGLSPGFPVVPKRASPVAQAGRKRGAKVPRLSQLSDEELMSGAALSLHPRRMPRI